ncbi:chromosome partitioning protein ParA [Vibrio campbellii]|uniref:chromosome partitioning protein ParA n=1 Tax=Vibrio campbellii TaxID=680 RepID=UPI00142E57EB|nr:chromosome partitioning protein ParA [Vibrio campbellii]NIY89351.1 chromosome partitioning protein ParA [Vibrio campbellii]NVK68409.1 chromosome partitioning protein ParA [Vibrio campbellii]
MKPISLITVSAVVAGTIWFSGKGGKSESLLPLSSAPEKTSEPQANDGASLAMSQSTDKVVVPKAKETPSPIEAIAKRLSELKGRAFKAEIEVFWHTCMSDHNCESQLAELEAHLSAERFALLANYHQLNSLWQQSLGNLLFDEQQPLASRIALLKSEAKKIWGELAEVIFADEFALYDFSLQAEQLASTPAQDYVQAYEDLLQTWQGSEAALGLESHQAKYERAVTLIPDGVTESEREALIQAFQQSYLSEQESEEIVARAQQITEQKQQVRDYQSELQQLELRLASQRATSHASWSDSEWQRYYQQEVADFRREFFAG